MPKRSTDWDVLEAIRNADGHIEAAKILGCHVDTIDYLLKRILERLGDSPGIEQLWLDYHQDHANDQCRNAIVDRYYNLVLVEWRRVAERIPEHVDRDSVQSAGFIALIRCVERFDLVKSDAKFSTYATWRIRGEMIDELRRLDPASRSVLRQYQAYLQAECNLQHLLGHQPTEHDIAQSMSITERQLQSRPLRIDSLSNLFSSRLDDGRKETLGGTIPQNSKPPIRDTIDRIDRLTRGLDLMSRMVILCYYTQIDMTLTEIGAMFELSESRCSQLLIEALKFLKEHRSRDETMEEMAKDK